MLTAEVCFAGYVFETPALDDEKKKNVDEKWWKYSELWKSRRS